MGSLRDRLADEGIEPDGWIVEKIESMDLPRKVGQMFMLAFAGEDPARAKAMIERRYLGGCYVSNANADSPEKAARLSMALQAGALESSGVPLLIGADQEGAWSLLNPWSTTGPGNLGLGAADDTELTRGMYRVLGEELLAVGYNTLLAPCADVNSNPLNPIIGMRSFGGQAERVSKHVAAALRGAREAGVATTVKHFPGHGNTTDDSHRGIPRVDRGIDELGAVDLEPFVAGIRDGVDIVMTSHILYSALDSALPATLSRPIVSGLLRDKLGFSGVVLSDSMNMRAIRRNYGSGQAAAMAVAAGVDMIMLAEEHYDHDAERYEVAQEATIDGVLEAVRRGDIDESAVDRAVYRILALKKARGLFERDYRAVSPSAVGSEAHRAIEAAVCAKLVCTLRNAAGRWPIPAEDKVALVRLAPRSAYGVLTSTRGIGPNQAESAFDAFRGEFLAGRAGVEVFEYYDRPGFAADPATALRGFDTIVAISEDYPLPGVDFDLADQRRALEGLLGSLGDRLVVIGLRSPYELASYPDLKTYISTCSSRPCAAKAAALAAFGRIPSVGVSPVSLGV